MTTIGSSPARPARAGLVLTVVCLCQVMVVLDASVVNVALPSIGRELGFEPSALSWVVNAYTLVFGGLLLLGGRFADHVGHRVAMFLGLGLFGLASIVGGFAQTPVELISARAAQGLSGAVLAPLSLTVIMVTFAEGARRSRAIGIWSMVAACGSALGVLLGGLLTEWLSWRWVLFVNVPIVVIAALLALPSVRDVRTARARRLDLSGAILVTVAVASLVYGTIEAGDHGWGSAEALVSFAAAVVLGALFVWRERRAAEPLVRFGVFRARSVWVATVVVLFVGAVTIAGFYFASLFLQEVLGFTPIQTGLAFLPFCAGTVVGAFVSGRLVALLGTRVVMAAGLALGAIGMFLFSLLHAGSTLLDGFLLPSVIASVGIGLCMVANTALATTGVAPHEAGLVSGLVNSARQIGGSVGLAALAVAATAAAGAAGATTPVEALVAGYDRAFAIAALIALIAAVVAAAFAPGRADRPAAAPQRASAEATESA